VFYFYDFPGKYLIKTKHFYNVLRTISITKTNTYQMKTNETIYKGVPLTNGRTTEMIDAIIESRNSMKTNELAELLGFDSFRQVNAICRLLNTANGTTKAKAPKASKKTKFKPVREAKNTFSNYYGEGKDKARDLIADAIMDTKRQSSNVLTLPAAAWIMEKNIIKKKSGYKFTAVEREKDTFNKMISNAMSNDDIKDSVIAYLNKSIGEVVVNDKEDTYSSMILDYCGFIDSFYDEINDILKRNLVKKGGYITITLAENDRQLNHSHHMNSHSNTYIQNCCANEDVSGARVTNDLVNILVFNNTGYKIVKKFNYKDKTVKMLLFVIKRNDD
ncbi:MAG TPA: hypothetical protein DGG95_16060, partial [Cytophagales bacterium]|nr:hypothetical protein [Cytophagales bacterium]